MKPMRFFVFLAVILSLVVFAAGTGFAEDNAPAEAAPVQETVQAPVSEAMPIKPMGAETAVSPAAVEFETQWVWGEVISLDPQNNQLAINYFDYETDMEKELKLAVDDKTKYENTNALADLKLHDTISVDYILTSDGRYTVRNISVEKPEESVVATEETTAMPVTP
ncbi:MAG: hypothetical protein WC532_04690 [Candidatus Omnitrophota bacterium]